MAGSEMAKNAETLMESTLLNLREAIDQPLTLRRTTRKHLLCSSSSTPPWTMLMCAYFFFFHSFLTLSLAQETESDLFTVYNTTCGGDTVQDTSTFNSNKATLISSLLQSSASYLYSSFKTSYIRQDLQGFYQCRGDLTTDLCNQCVAMATNGTHKNNCSSTTSFRTDMGGCSVLYVSASDNITSNSLTYLWSLANNTNTVASTSFVPARDTLLTNLSSVAPSDTSLFAHGNYTYASNASSVYALVQCFGILNPSQCAQCLSLMTSSGVLDTLANATKGLIYYGSCFGRFSSSPFYSRVNTQAAPRSVSAESNPAPQESTSTNSTAMLPMGIGIGLGTLLVFALLFFYRRQRIQKQKQKQKQKQASGRKKEDGLEEGFRVFSIEELKRATQNFHQANSLGKGGFGHVYKGTLDNGETIAVKKLALSSDQAETQFVAEVKFITSVQHRNLIRLHGYCVDSTERILVYEFLPNQSLDKHIFNEDKNERRILSWRKRLRILMGTARGLAYMHHDCHQRIIHRDIKAANILLDESLNPKIADFGLAKLFKIDKTQVDTRIAGTLGYLAPEYYLHARLSEKADVYSFGVVMLEVVCGRKVIGNEGEQNLLKLAWKLFKAEAISQLVDVALGEEYDMDEATQVVSLALSCTQDSSSARPSMNNVVAILGNYTNDMANQLPGQPGFTPKTRISMTSLSSTYSNDSHPLSEYYATSTELVKEYIR